MSFTIKCLDHVAIRVKDLTVSTQWYTKVLGLKKYQLPEWGEFPIFLLSGKTGVALFPAKLDDPEFDPDSRNVKIDHFAFYLDREEFDKAIEWYDKLGIEYSIQDHTYFLSVYTNDPDEHTVELTTLLVEADDFYTQ